MFVTRMTIRCLIVTFVTIKERLMLRNLWKLVSRKENWESRMGWEYFALVFLGGLLAGFFQWV